MMKKIILIISLSLPIYSMANGINDDRAFEKYLDGYAREAAKFHTCGEYDMGAGDTANIGIYLDEILSPRYLKLQIKKYGSRQKAGIAAIKKVEALADTYQKRLVQRGVPSGMCAKLLEQYN